MKLTKKIIAVFLTMLTLFSICSVAMPVFAEYEWETGYDIVDDMEIVSEEAEPEIISEITEKRQENTKYFLMSDGSFMAAQYSGPVHYVDSEGEWADYDNSLSETEATQEQADLFGESELYITGNEANNVVFAPKSNSNTLVSYEAKDYPISLNYQSAKKSYIKVNDEELELKGNDAYLTLPHVSQEVLYEDVFSDVDLQYIVNPGEIKENIILKSKDAENTFTVNYNIGVLTAEVVDSRTINLMSGEEVIYTISAPYMYDAAGAMSEAVTLTVNKNKNGKFRVTIVANSEWLQSVDRVYPVVLDPTITTETTKDAIDSVFVANNSSYINRNFVDRMEMLVGRETSNYGYCRSLFKFDLPALNKGDMVVAASLNVAYYDYDVYASTTPDLQVNAHLLQGSWDKTTVTWNNCPSYSSTILDYQMFTRDVGWKTFDISSAVKQWYEGESTNYGILLKGASETGTMAENGFKAAIWTERYNTQTDYYPRISITYRSNKGLEDYWSYTTVSAGNTGSAYINDYTGNLVFAANLFSSSNELMPLSVDCIYNGYCSADKYVSGKSSSSLTVPGKGWRLSVQQTLLPSSEYGLPEASVKTYPYVYTDGDGTEHYIYEKTEDGTTTYEDEDGLGLILTFGDKNSSGEYNRYYLTDKKGNVLVFNEKGNLLAIKDPEGNKVKLTYNAAGTKILSIIDSAGLDYTITYETDSNCIDYITNPWDKKIEFSHSSSDQLIKLTYPNNNYIDFTYDTQDSLLTTKDSDGYKLSFAYTTSTKGKRVSSVSEYGDDINGEAQLGQQINFDRSKYNTTVISTAGTDGVYNNDDDLITTYKFDNCGRTITQQLKTRGGTHSVAGVYNYTEDSSTDLKSNNKVKGSANLGKNVVNHIINSNAEDTTDWTSGCSGSSSTTCNVSSTYSYIGDKSLYVKNTAINSTGDKGYWYQGITGLTAGATYTLSAYVKTKDLAVVNPGNETGAYLFTRYIDANGSYVYNYSEYLDESTSVDINNGWRKLSVTVNLPDGISSLRAYLGFKDATGTAYFDCIQLEAASVANDYNLVQNPSFEKSTSGMPNKWSTSTVSYQASGGTVNEGVSQKHNVGGNNSFVIEGEPSVSKNIYQDIAVYGNANDTYIVSGWARANAVSERLHEDSRFEINIRVFYTDSNGNTYSEYKTPAKFNADVSGWQYTAQAFTLKSSQNATYQPTKVRVILSYASQVNYGYFDNIQLIKDVAQTYEYDSEGNIESVVANAEQKSDMTYEGSDLKTYTDVLGNTTTFTYDDKHNLETSKSPGRVWNRYTYNEKGQVEESKITNTTEGVAIKTKIDYTDNISGVYDGAYVESVSDEHGNLTTYGYDAIRGLTTSVTNAKDITTNYTYSEYTNRLKSVSSEDSSVSYTYDGDRLSTITFGPSNDDSKDVYRFNYDNWGNVLSTQINNKALSTNTYGVNNGVLQKTTYGNGTERRYTYDDFGNLKTVKDKNNNSLYAWYYDSSMTPIIHSDVSNNLKYYYDYDSIGRLIRQEVTDRTTGAHIGSFEYTYDVRNNVVAITSEMGGRTFTQNYSYEALSETDTVTARYASDNLPVRYSVASSRYIDYEYDSINRLQKKTLNTATPYVISYGYKASSEFGKEGSFVTSQLSTEVNGDTSYYYTYDVLGNIVDINSKTTGDYENYRNYTYDELNQLLREDNASAGKTYTYEYDALGNITQKKVYAYTTGTLPSTAQQTITYTYSEDSDAGWNKLLTSYNGQTIDYDDIGNPTTYSGASLEWDGRSLKSYSNPNTNTSISYTYDADGLRGTKTVNGTKSTYHYVSGQLLYERRGTTDIYYYYDSYGTPTAIKYYEANGTTHTFYLATNALGDVIGIYNASGNLVVKYEYDAWGNIVAETNASGDEPTTLAQHWSEINPFRYRGYYYDGETGLYYLQSRYYDPEIGRFINADSLIDNRGIITQNLFQYCGNNPVNNADPSGNLFGAIVGIGLLVIGMVATLSGCSSKPAASPSKPSTPSKPSNPSSSSSTTSPHIPTPQEKSYAATVYAEAGGQNKRSKQAVAHVMNNRIGTRSSWTDIESVISAKYQFDGYNSPMYQAAMNYYNNGICNNSIEQAAMDECLAVVIPIYSGAESDITGGALYFHSFANPSDWAYHNFYTQVYVRGTEKFWFYK